MKTLFKQIIDENHLPSGLDCEFAYVVNRDGKRLKELLWHLDKLKMNDRHLSLAKDLTNKLLEEYK